MNTEERIRHVLKKKAEEIEAPSELKEKVLRRAGVSRKLPKRVAGLLLAALIVLPTGAFAYQMLLADDVYGSFETVQKHIAGFTMKSYLLIDAKLAQAKGVLGQEEYETFKELARSIINAKMEYGDPYGNINYDQLPADLYEAEKATLIAAQPYFDRLNDLPVLETLLTEAEMDAYIEAVMKHQTIMAKSGINTSEGIGRERIPAELRAEYDQVKATLEHVHTLQASY
ncbi:DUF3600 domain-containing protein [Alkalihalobacillus oceani]|uniref:DUF3600 domain-containing protein n=1 Tax=Halalkalibacter oceani TaxID=1653776 RepID=A0A9X2IP08_9BACI|nr:DUF3600 domain-containing protein [Halalkalibacter oceani]MCM3714755.1 DUF3600 domain-containing protein [Halalkalibacter oceani]